MIRSWLAGIPIRHVLLLPTVALVASACFVTFATSAAAKAPPHATTILDVQILSPPAMDATVIGVVPAGTEFELTGDAAPGYLEVYYDGEPAWVPAQYLTLGVKPGIDTAVAVVDTPLLEAPLPEADVLATVPEGETVILTGARLDGYDAASHDRVGGWIKDKDLAR